MFWFDGGLLVNLRNVDGTLQNDLKNSLIIDENNRNDLIKNDARLPLRSATNDGDIFTIILFLMFLNRAYYQWFFNNFTDNCRNGNFNNFY